MRIEPDASVIVAPSARGFGAGVTVDPAFDIGEEADPWTQQHVVERPVLVTDYNVRCAHRIRLHGTDNLSKVCNALLGIRLTRPYTVGCRKCKQETAIEVEG